MNFRDELSKVVDRRSKKDVHVGKEILEKIIFPYMEHIPLRVLKGQINLSPCVTEEGRLFVLLYEPNSDEPLQNNFFSFSITFEEKDEGFTAYKYLKEKFESENFDVKDCDTEGFKDSCIIKIKL